MTNDGYRMTNKIVGQGFSLAVEVLVLISMFCFLVSCSSFFCMSEQARTQKAQKEFLKTLSIVDRSIVERKGTGSEFNKAVDILEGVTGIKGHREHQFVTAYFDKELLKQDFQKWKDWYEKNKDKLYWDEKEKKIIVWQREIQEKEFDVSNVKNLSVDTLASYPDWCKKKSSEGVKFSSPDGNKEISVEQTEKEYQLVLRKAEDRLSKLIDVSKYGFSSPDWDITSNKIVYFSVKEIGQDYRYGDVVLFDITSKMKTILKKDLAYSEPKWSLDGTMIVFSDFGSIFIVDSDGKREKQIREGGYPELCSGFCWSPEGNEIVFTRWTSVHHEELGKQILSIKLGPRER